VEKELLRKRILSLRRSLSYEEIQKKSEKIKQRLFSLPAFDKARALLFYLSLKDEVQTRDMIKEALKLNKIVAVPLIKLKERNILPARLYRFDEDLTIGPLGIPQPKGNLERLLPLNEIELVIVPGVAFDEKGNRIGFGMGFYDRFLKKLPARVEVVALAFELQLVQRIPSQPHDISVDCIVTERRIIHCKNKGGFYVFKQAS